MDDYVAVPNSASLNISSEITVELWMKTTTTQNLVVLEKSNTNTNYGIQTAAGSLSGKVGFFISPNFSTGQIWSSTNINDGQWHHIAGTFNSASNTSKLNEEAFTKTLVEADALHPLALVTVTV